MKTILSGCLILFANLCLAQNYLGIKLGANHPINYSSSELVRKFGGEVGFNYGVRLNKQLFFETGINFEVFGRKAYNEIIIYTDSRGIDHLYNIKNPPYTTISSNIPFYLNFKMSNFGLRTGFLLNRKLCSFTEYDGIDPEIGYQPTSQSDFKTEGAAFGIDFGLGLNYAIFRKLDLYMNFKTPIYYFTRKVNYGVFSLGLNYKFGSR
jgi:hypothetical protein